MGLRTSSKILQYDFLLNDLAASQDVSIVNTAVFSTFRYLFASKFLISTGARVERNDYEKKRYFAKV